MQCPGQDSRYWDGEAGFESKCPNCGNVIEFFRDDSTRRCSQCGDKVINPRIDFGCASYCPYAEQCLGTLPPELLAGKQDELKSQVAVAMKKYFGDDFKRIGHATKVARYAEKIGEAIGAHPAVVLIVAYLHDIGIKEAERKFNSSSATLQHQEGPPVARKILLELGAEKGLIDEVCDIVGHHHQPRQEETDNFKALYDADLIVNLEERVQGEGMAADVLERIIGKSFLTPPGRDLGRKVLMKA